jgi:hypothetical protein
MSDDQRIAQQCASVAVAARLCEIPLRQLRSAVSRGDLKTYKPGGGRKSLLILDEIKSWLRTQPKARRKNQHDVGAPHANP